MEQELDDRLDVPLPLHLVPQQLGPLVREVKHVHRVEVRDSRGERHPSLSQGLLPGPGGPHLPTPPARTWGAGTDECCTGVPIRRGAGVDPPSRSLLSWSGQSGTSRTRTARHPARPQGGVEPPQPDVPYVDHVALRLEQLQLHLQLVVQPAVPSPLVGDALRPPYSGSVRGSGPTYLAPRRQ